MDVMDGIPAFIVKRLSKILALPMANVINESFPTGAFHRLIKGAVVTPIPKTEQLEELSHCRLIFILTVFSKVLKKVVYSQIAKNLRQNNFMSPRKHGFLRSLSTESLLLESVDAWKKLVDEGGFSVVVMIDIQNAFDPVDHRILMEKLNLVACYVAKLEWLKSYLSDRKQTSERCGVKSMTDVIRSGDPQGQFSVLSCFCCT